MESRNERTEPHGSRGSGLVLTAFGTVWWLSGTAVLSGGAGTLLPAAGVVCAVVLCLLAVRRLGTHGEREVYERSAGRFRTVSVVQMLAIGGIVAVSTVFGAQPWIPGAVAVVVGLHFLPLAGLFERPEYRWAGR